MNDVGKPSVVPYSWDTYKNTSGEKAVWEKLHTQHFTNVHKKILGGKSYKRKFF